MSANAPAVAAPGWSPETVTRITEMMAADYAFASKGPRHKQIDLYACDAEEVTGHLTCHAKIRHHTMTVDEPVAFGGEDSAPNPVEAVMAALAASLQVTTRLYAVHWGIPVRGIRTKLEGAMDLRGFFDTDPTVPSGLDRLDVLLLIETDVPPPVLERLAAQVRRSCPVLDMLGKGGWLRLEICRSAASADAGIGEQ